MSESSNRGGLSGRLASHFALCGVAALGIAATSASADVIYSGVQNLTIASTTNGLYLNVVTGAYNTTGGGGATVAGWDVNLWSSTGLSFFNPSSPTGGVYARVSAATPGVSNLAANTVIGPSTLWTGGVAQTTGSNPFVLNSDQNLVGFRFTNENGGTVHYGWMRVRLSGTLQGQPRTLVEWAFESTPNTPIIAGSIGGPPPAYDPCAPTNPSVSNGSNLPAYRTDTVADLSVCGGTIPAANYYKFTTVDAGSYTFQACPTTGSATIALLSACDGSASVIGCGASACGGTGSSVTTVLNAATTIYVVVGGSGLGSNVPVVVTAPPIDICVSAVNATYGDNVIDSTQGSTVSQNVFNNVAQSAQDTIFRPQWFRFKPTATGDFTFKTCLAGDTRLAIGTGCPSSGGVFSTIAYNDDAPLCLDQPEPAGFEWASWIDATNNGAVGIGSGFPLTQQLVAGQTYYICVGAYSSFTDPIAGNLNISGPEGSPCPADYDGDGAVGGTDLTTLLAAWGTPAGDIDGDSNTSGTDLTTLLAAWGPCAP